MRFDDVRARAPILKVDINAACDLLWAVRPLGTHISELETLMMTSVDAPSMFDGIPLRGSNSRSKTLVDVITKSFSSNPQLAGMLKRVAPAMREDRAARVSDGDQISIHEAASQISRQIEVKSTYRPRA